MFDPRNKRQHGSGRKDGKEPPHGQTSTRRASSPSSALNSFTAAGLNTVNALHSVGRAGGGEERHVTEIDHLCCDKKGALVSRSHNIWLEEWHVVWSAHARGHMALGERLLHAVPALTVCLCACVWDDWGIAHSVTTADKHGWHFWISQKKKSERGRRIQAASSRCESKIPRGTFVAAANLLSCLFISYLLNACCWSKDNTALCFHSGKNKESPSLRSGCMVLITASTPGKTSQNMCLIAACGQRPEPWVVGLVVHVSDIIRGGAHVVINEPLWRDAPPELQLSSRVLLLRRWLRGGGCRRRR